MPSYSKMRARELLFCKLRVYKLQAKQVMSCELQTQQFARLRVAPCESIASLQVGNRFSLHFLSSL